VISSAELISNFEHCQREGYWSQHWHLHRMSPTDMFNTAVRQALLETAPDVGENAGELMMTLAADRGLDVSDSINLYRCARNHAAAADIIVTAIRQQNDAWTVLPPVNGWTPSAYVDPCGGHLRRFLAVSSWHEEREFYERHSWFCLGEIAHYRMPMQMVIAILGPLSGGRRHGHFSKALLHPQGSELRFRPRRRATIDGGFRETWRPVYREDHDEIERQKWLQAMYDDEVLQETLFVVNIPVPEETQLATIRDLASRQLERLAVVTDLPEKQLSTCHNPIAPCPFRQCCWSDPEGGPEAGGYDSFQLLGSNRRM